MVFMGVSKTIVLRGKVYDVTTSPLVMGIVNITPDSFAFHCTTDDEIRCCIEKHLNEGADILDLGGYSTRPNASVVSIDEEWQRLKRGLDIVCKYNVPLSIDTFREEIVHRAMNEYEISMVNDVSGELVVKDVAYVLVYPLRGEVSQMLEWFTHKVYDLHILGVHDVIIDPGFGFGGKTLEENYTILQKLEALQMLDCTILVGLSRKSMLGVSVSEALPATCVVNLVALQKGANILRVHDVREAKEVITIYKRTLC